MASPTSGFHNVDAGRLKGGARAALVCAAFGSAWMYWAVAWSGHPTPLWFSTVTFLTVALTAWAVLRLRALRHFMASPEDRKQAKAMRKFILIDSGVEWGLISVGALLLSRIGRPDLMPQLCGVIVGLHFLPIAKVFRLPFYYWVGGIMIVGEASSILIIRGDLRNIVGCASVGLTLWVASAVILFRISAAFRAPSDR